LNSQSEFLLADMGKTMAIIRNMPNNVDADKIMTLAFMIKLTSAQITEIHIRNGMVE
jgi:hypothetical protein